MNSLKSNIVSIQMAARDLKIETADDVEKAEGLLKIVHEGEKSITNRKQEITRPLMKALESGRDLFKPLELGFANAKKTIKQKLKEYDDAEDERIALEQSRIAARVAKGTMTAETAANKIMESEPKTRANTRINKKLVIEDESLLPREYLVPERALITKALLEGVAVAGAKLVEEKIIAVKR